jgi:hypothetical protein
MMLLNTECVGADGKYKIRVVFLARQEGRKLQEILIY